MVILYRHHFKRKNTQGRVHLIDQLMLEGSKRGIIDLIAGVLELVLPDGELLDEECAFGEVGDAVGEQEWLGEQGLVVHLGIVIVGVQLDRCRYDYYKMNYEIIGHIIINSP